MHVEDQRSTCFNEKMHLDKQFEDKYAVLCKNIPQDTTGRRIPDSNTNQETRADIRAGTYWKIYWLTLLPTAPVQFTEKIEILVL